MTVDDRYRVLVVDDDPDVAELTRTVIERRTGAEVIVVNGPSTVLTVVDEFEPDVVVTDIEMPGMTGLALLSLVRESHPGLPVVVMTAHASADYAIKAVRAQADEFLTKPVASAELAATVLRLANQGRGRRADAMELTRAAEVQRGLLPQQLVDLAGFELAGGCATARVVGGDFFDWYPVAGGAAFTIADVMGKGIGAAIIAASVRSTLRAELAHADLERGFDAAASRLESDLARAGSFVTVFHSVLDAATGVVRFVDAGHGLSLLVRADGSSDRLATSSLPVGLEAEPGVHSDWIVQSVQLHPGDTLVSASDGILDLYDGSLASLDNVVDIVRAAPSAQAVIDRVLELAGEHAPDDVTVVALRRA